MIDIVGLYDDLLLAASYAGIPFQMLDANDEAGRRVQQFLFPGSDAYVFQDLGQADVPIQVSGIMVGDDYVQQASALRAAFQQPGPGTLVHPWLGTVLVRLVRPARFSFSQAELRVARFTASFKLEYPPAPSAIDTLTELLDAVTNVQVQVGAALAQLLAPAVLTVAAIGYVQGFANTMAARWSTLTANAADPTVAPAAAAYAATFRTAGAPGPTLALAQQALALGDAISAASDIAFTSQQEATGYYQRLSAALATATTQAAALGGSQPTGAGSVWRALVALQAALAADMSALIGRLPAVQILTLPQPVPAWVVAQYLSGDDPANLFATYFDLVARNDVLNPGAMPAGSVEVLLPA